MYLRMLNAVSSGSRLANVTPVRSGGSRSKSCGSRARPQAATARAASSRIERGTRNAEQRSEAAFQFRVPTSAFPLALPRRTDPDRLATARSEDDVQARRRIDRPPRDRDRQRIGAPVRAGPVGVNLRDVLPPACEKREWDIERAALLVRDGPHVPSRTVSL